MALTDSMKQVLMDRVDSYGNHHTLRCLALASKPMSASNEQVPPLSVFVCTLGWLLDLNMYYSLLNICLNSAYISGSILSGPCRRLLWARQRGLSRMQQG